MGAFIGAILGAAALMAIGKAAKGRDFIGVSVAMFLFSLVLCVLLSPIFYQAMTVAGAQPHLETAAIILSAVIAFLFAVVPGGVFIALADSKGGD